MEVVQKNRKIIGKGIFLFISLVLYYLIYYGLFFLIEFLHASVSIISVPAILIPWALFMLALLLWKNRIFMITASILSILPVVFLGTQLWIHKQESTFTPDKWKTKEQQRIYMMDDLNAKHPLSGKKQEEIIQLLGQEKLNSSYKNKNTMVYYLGQEGDWFKMSSAWLVLNLDDQGKVIDYQIKFS